MQLFPLSFSALEKCQALALIDEVQSATRAYAGEFTASWLLNSIYSPVWKISKGKETRLVDGEMSNYYEYKWATTLYDGSNLIDPINKKLLNEMQRLAFLAREIPGGPNTLSTLKNFLWSLNLFVRWVFLNEALFQPRQFSLTRVKTQHFVDFFTDMGKGGTVFALRYPQRILHKIFPIVLGRQPTADELQNILHLDRDDCFKVTHWIKKNGGFEKVRRTESGSMSIKCAFLANLISVDVGSIRAGAPRWLAFLGQFEVSDVPYDERQTGTNRGSRRECPSQKTISLEEARDSGVSEKSLGKYFDDFLIIVSLHRHLPESCPDPNQFKPKIIRQVITEVSQVSKHTPWIPLAIAMDYTTEAIRWVHLYGEDLISLFISCYRELNDKGLLVSPTTTINNRSSRSEYVMAFREISRAREIYISSIEIPESLKSLNLKGWGTYIHLDGKKGFLKLRSAPSINDAIMVLIGAITVIVAMTKPMRESEFRALKTDCLKFVDRDGYWLSQELRKQNSGDVRFVDMRPIPVIAAKSLQLLRRLTDGLKEITCVKDRWLLDSLVTLPSFGRYEAKIINVISPGQLFAMLDTFCDYVALKPDTAGRRWYLRIHEMRKSFLITFFWTFRYASLDAARWMAGHRDSSEIYAYIQANFPGEELPRLEAEYAAQVLRDYEQAGSKSDIKYVNDLHKAVCDHFSVSDVSWIDEENLRNWLEMKFDSKDFQIIPCSIRSHDGRVKTEIAFKVTF